MRYKNDYSKRNHIYNTVTDPNKELLGSTAKFTGIINGDPLSDEQLREFIISQSMTIDRLLTLNDEMINALKQIKDMLLKGNFYLAWITINKVLD